jgi:hypothetical protein
LAASIPWIKPKGGADVIATGHRIIAGETVDYEALAGAGVEFD